jgi:hypothetical protein
MRRHGGDPIGDEAVAGRGVEQSGRGQPEEGERQSGEGHPLGEARGPAPAPAARQRRRRGRGRFGFVHQKAWPSET